MKNLLNRIHGWITWPLLAFDFWRFKRALVKLPTKEVASILAEFCQELDITAEQIAAQMRKQGIPEEEIKETVEAIFGTA